MRVVESLRESGPKLTASGRNSAAAGRDRAAHGGGLLSGVPFEAVETSVSASILGLPVCHEIFKSGTKWEVSRRQLGAS